MSESKSEPQTLGASNAINAGALEDQRRTMLTYVSELQAGVGKGLVLGIWGFRVSRAHSLLQSCKCFTKLAP